MKLFLVGMITKGIFISIIFMLLLVDHSPTYLIYVASIGIISGGIINIFSKR